MKIAIVGLGLIGGSIAKAISVKTNHKVYGIDISDITVKRAKLIEAIEDRATDEEIVSCDIIILALYPRVAIKWFKSHASLIKEGTIVVDTCGIKSNVCYMCEKIAKENNLHFIGAHPMAGIEKSGFASSKYNLFEGASMIITPHKGMDIKIVDKICKLSREIGFNHIQVSTPQEHDKMIAYTSQLAHIVSSAYVKSECALKHKGFSAGSFRDMTRVAKLDEHMWTELFMDNKDYIVVELDGIIERLCEYREAISHGDEKNICRLLKEGREYKERSEADDE